MLKSFRGVPPFAGRVKGHQHLKGARTNANFKIHLTILPDHLHKLCLVPFDSSRRDLRSVREMSRSERSCYYRELPVFLLHVNVDKMLQMSYPKSVTSSVGTAMQIIEQSINIFNKITKKEMT